MSSDNFSQLFSQETLIRIFPPQRSDQFFEALFGDASEGAYDISLVFKEHRPKDNTLLFELHLSQRPGCCLACNLTHGLPQVFSRHPVIDIKGVVAEIDKLLGDRATCKEWRLGATNSVSRALHTMPLIITLG
ncbi:MAG: pancreas/duodenum homeobox protein 1 [Desulfobulbaceae bacterium]|nr:pancreas/duodenum homeobox protein 1 [Desulfobulbaceae bacterium]